MDLKIQGRVKMPSEGEGSWMGVDYSHTYKENDALEEDLEETLEHLEKDESRSLAAKGEKVQQIRRQVEAISRLQDAVNASQPGESATLIHNTRSRFSEFEAMEFAEKAKISKTEKRLNMERDKFSAKSLFNRRGHTPGSEVSSAAKFVTATALRVPSFEEEQLETVDELIDDHNKTTVSHPTPLPTLGARIAMNNRTFPRTKTSKPKKGYLRDTAASQHGRPGTAIGTNTTNDIKYDDILPPRSQSAMRSRSRRELEILSRIEVKEEEPLVNEFGLTNWKAVYEKRRKNKLQDLKTQDEALQRRIKGFVAELDSFNKRPRTAWK